MSKYRTTVNGMSRLVKIVKRVKGTVMLVQDLETGERFQVDTADLISQFNAYSHPVEAPRDNRPYYTHCKMNKNDPSHSQSQALLQDTHPCRPAP